MKSPPSQQEAVAETWTADFLVFRRAFYHWAMLPPKFIIDYIVALWIHCSVSTQHSLIAFCNCFTNDIVLTHLQNSTNKIGSNKVHLKKKVCFMDSQSFVVGFGFVFFIKRSGRLQCYLTVDRWWCNISFALLQVLGVISSHQLWTASIDQRPL